MTEHIVHVLPLGPSEARGRGGEASGQVGVTFEPGLLAELVGDVSRQPNALPLFQYALTELFDRREGDELTLARYEALGGLRGAVASRAEATFTRLEPDRQEPHGSCSCGSCGSAPVRRLDGSCRRTSWPHSTSTSSRCRTRWRRSSPNRLLTVDRDPASGAATVIPHEALLVVGTARGVDRERPGRPATTSVLRGRHARVAGRRPRPRLPPGRRAARARSMAEHGDDELTEDERTFLDEAVLRRDEATAARPARGRRGACAPARDADRSRLVSARRPHRCRHGRGRARGRRERTSHDPRA